MDVRGVGDVGQPNMRPMGEFQESGSSRSNIEAAVSDYVPCGRGNCRRVWWPNNLRPFRTPTRL